jgi:1-deoxyxylulose-5-phosphate synthase
MERRALGTTGRTISAIGLGCATFGREIDEEASFRILDHAVDNGITFLDTAEAYGGGQARLYRKTKLGLDDVREVTGVMSSSERIIGRWLRARKCRDAITLCSKVSTGGSAENIPRALSGSLERLGTGSIDIYMMHSPDPKIPIDETLDALNKELESGRACVIGCSNYSSTQLQEALECSAAKGYRRFEIAQPAYSLAAPGAEKELFPLCRRQQIAVAAYSPLAAGFLTGKYTPDRSRFPKGSRFDVMPGHADIYFSERNFRLVARLRQKAHELGVPMARLAMAWAMSHPAVTAVLVGARTTGHVDNALEALKIGLGPELRAEMSAWD